MEVWYINLKRRPDRNSAILKAFQEAEVPKEQIRRLEAKDRDVYASPKALAADAIADGFTCFGTDKTRHTKFYGYTWSYLRALREIANQSETVLLIEDDKALNIKYQNLQEMLSEIPDFNIAHLGYSRIRRQCPDFSQHWVKGILASGNSCTIFKPEGARWMLKKCIETFPKTPETVIRDFYMECPGGIYALKHVYRRQFIRQLSFESDVSTSTAYEQLTAFDHFSP